MSRRHDLRRIKAHWSYTAVELAETLRVCLSTIRVWTREGLRPIEGTWPYLFAAADIVAFLKSREQPRQPLKPGEIFSVAVRGPRVPADGVVDLVSRSATSADIVGRCPDTGRRIHRRVCLSRLAEALGTLKVRWEDATVPIGSDRIAPRIAQIEGPVS
ncbi:MAG TPA: helix-turn-helix domain-containing protein [Allosphingosinicella sp.]|nr:helix-turn-helix domain-containing protein [Allosphingosinicella sp.]